MIILLTFIVTSLIVAALVCVWGLFCNEITYKQRIAIINHQRTLPFDEYKRQADMYDLVSYDSHMWALFFFRDPRLLYAPELRVF